MKPLCAAVVLAVLTVGLVAAQEAAPAAQPAANPANQIKGPIPVKLLKNIDSKKLKVGDTVTFQTVSAVHSNSGLMIPSGAMVIGHVTQAQARSKGDANSTLAIAFDKIEYSKGESIPMTGVLQAIGPSLGTSGPTNEMYGNVLSSKGGNGSSPPPTSSMQVGGAVSGTPVLTGGSQGVRGVKGLEMDSSGVLTSSSKEVRLDTDMQIIVRAEINLPSR